MLPGYLPTSEPNAQVVLTTMTKIVATGTLLFVGGIGGETKKHGGRTVGLGRSLIALQSVISSSARPCFSYNAGPVEEKAVESSTCHFARNISEFPFRQQTSCRVLAITPCDSGPPVT